MCLSYLNDLQIVLSPEEQRDVLDRLHNNLRHITEALSTVTTAMGFLASAGSCPDVSCALKDYILKVLKIRRTEFCANVSSSYMSISYGKMVSHCLIHCCAFPFSTPCRTFCPSGKPLHWRKHGCTQSMERRYKFYYAIRSTLMIVICIRPALLRFQCNTRFLSMATMMPQVSCFIQCLRKLKDNTRRP